MNQVDDDAIRKRNAKKNFYELTLKNNGGLVMPIIIEWNYTDGTKENFNIALRMMYGNKPTQAKVLEAWPWVQPIYSFSTDKLVKTVVIDPLQEMADIDKNNNLFEAK